MSERRHVRWCLLAGACGLLAAGAVDWRFSVVTPVPLLAGAPEKVAGVPRETLMQVAAAPLHFERNDGQAPSGVAFMARGAGYAVLLSATETAVLLSSDAKGDDRAG